MIGVQAELAPAIYLSFKEGRMVETEECNTFAEGMATRAPVEGTFDIIRELVDDIVLVSEEEMYEAIRLYLEKTHNLAEGAGAAPLAAALKIKEQLKGKKVVLILSGGNLSLEQLRTILNHTPGQS
jgi:threonine dehydratase